MTPNPDLFEEGWLEWYLLTPQERWAESERLWEFYLAIGASLIRNPILKVLSTLASHQVRYLLMGGQACVLYGAAEFSRDTDVAVLAESENLDRLRAALDELQARPIAVPALTADYLLRGHAVHFRCHHPDAERMRIDLMSVMRGVDGFSELSSRRTTVSYESGVDIELMALPDLVTAKKTQRDKDWPMIRRLVEADYAQRGARPTAEQVDFWLRECRTPSILIEMFAVHAEAMTATSTERPLLQFAITGDESALRDGLEEEERRERRADREYWEPLRAELEQLRRRRRGER